MSESIGLPGLPHLRVSPSPYPPSARGLCHPAAMNHEEQLQHDDDSVDDIPDIEGEPPPAGEYRLSTRGPVVGGGS